MTQTLALTGNEAGAAAMRQINPDVVAAYPITPQTELMHAFSKFVADGKVKTELILVESEHSAMSACIGSASAGARTMTATSANGLALMWEVVYIAASLRIPMVMPVVNRALSGPINIHCDHSDTMGCRDSGWLQLFSENSQEAYDNVIQAMRIAEHKDVLLPVMVTWDGFIISHTTERVEILDDGTVKKFIGEYTPERPLLDTDNPVTIGPLDLSDYFFEHKRQQVDGVNNAYQVIKDIGKEYGKLSGRSYGLVEEYQTDDAEMIAVALGSTAGTIKAVVDRLRREGMKVGLLKIRSFRPFPFADVASILRKAKAIAVFDRSIAYGSMGGPLFGEIRSALYGEKEQPPALNYVYGLGGRDINTAQIEGVYQDLEKAIKTNKYQTIKYLGVRE
ncbi:MAG: pyruvate ferredoxin oxidoreductase [Nitrospirae bacterium]|nr:pyruvate ferredoxin oxidoreductase [Nitrospirota bacterium]